MQRRTIYEGENGQQFATKKEAEAALVKGITSRLNLLHSARERLHATPHAERAAMLLAVQGQTGRTVQQWCEQLASLANDLNELQGLE